MSDQRTFEVGQVCDLTATVLGIAHGQVEDLTHAIKGRMGRVIPLA